MTSDGKRLCTNCQQKKWLNSYWLHPDICSKCCRDKYKEETGQVKERICLRCDRRVKLKNNNRVCDVCKRSEDYQQLSRTDEFTLDL